ncbi:MAG: hypothetical protein JOZ47_13915 [Kutzneria sp.]|nr:hypothetical protein [Kutzneria sp.]
MTERMAPWVGAGPCGHQERGRIANQWEARPLMSLFGQVWLLCLFSFVIGAALSSVLFARPLRKRVRGLTRQLAYAERDRIAALSMRPLVSVTSANAAQAGMDPAESPLLGRGELSPDHRPLVSQSPQEWSWAAEAPQQVPGPDHDQSGMPAYLLTDEPGVGLDITSPMAVIRADQNPTTAESVDQAWSGQALAEDVPPDNWEGEYDDWSEWEGEYDDWEGERLDENAEMPPERTQDSTIIQLTGPKSADLLRRAAQVMAGYTEQDGPREDTGQAGGGPEADESRPKAGAAPAAASARPEQFRHRVAPSPAASSPVSGPPAPFPVRSATPRVPDVEPSGGRKRSLFEPVPEPGGRALQSGPHGFPPLQTPAPSLPGLAAVPPFTPRMVGDAADPKPASPSTELPKRTAGAEAWPRTGFGDTPDLSTLPPLFGARSSSGPKPQFFPLLSRNADQAPIRRPLSGGPRTPFGPGSALPKPDGSAPSPDYVVKALVSSRRYHTAESAEFQTMNAEVWFRSVEEAKLAGFRSTDTENAQAQIEA